MNKASIQRLRIALLTSFPIDVAVGSGVVRMITGLTTALRQFGAQIDLIHPNFKPTSYLNLAVQRLRFNRHLRLNEYDLLIGSDFDGFTFSREQQPKLVLNGGLLADIVRFEEGAIRRILQHLALRECQNIRSASVVVAPSQYTANQIQALYGYPKNRIRIVPLGIDWTHWQTLLSNAKQSVLSQPTILCVAKQYPRKGIPDLLKATQIVSNKIPNVKLILVGDGPQSTENKALATRLGLSHRVEFVGDVTDDALLAAYYRNAHVFCLPSYHETFGIVFLEAMAARLPIVAYAETAVTEVVSSAEGMLASGGNVAQLAQNLVTLLNNKKLREKLGENGFKKAQQFTWQESARRLLSVIAELTQSRNV